MKIVGDSTTEITGGSWLGLDQCNLILLHHLLIVPHILSLILFFDDAELPIAHPFSRLGCLVDCLSLLLLFPAAAAFSLGIATFRSCAPHTVFDKEEEMN